MKNRKIMIAGMLICAITAGCGTALPHADGMGETERETKEAQLNSSDETEKIQSIHRRKSRQKIPMWRMRTISLPSLRGQGISG